MGKFDDKIAEKVKLLKERHGESEPIVTFQWDSGYAVIRQSHFLKMKKRDKNKLLEPLSKQTTSNVQAL